MLQSLNLFRCERLSGDLSPLAELTSLQSLNLSFCKQLSGDLSPLANLTSFQSLDMSYCRDFRRFSPLESLLPTLKKLYLAGCEFDDLSSEICGKTYGESVLYKVRAHYRQRQPAASPQITAAQPLGTPPRSSFLTPGEISHPMPPERISNARKSSNGCAESWSKSVGT